jgi:predicted Fe-Mo cluster-binding NifX family protein
MLFGFILLFQPHMMGVEPIIIAVASEGKTLEAPVSQVAARGPYFLIVDDKGNVLEAAENPHKDTRGGAGVAAADFLAAKNVTVVVAGKFGNKMKSGLEENDITCVVFEGTAGDAVKEILKDEGGT